MLAAEISLRNQQTRMRAVQAELATIRAAVEHLQAQNQGGRVTSVHATAWAVTQIEIVTRPGLWHRQKAGRCIAPAENSR